MHGQRTSARIRHDRKRAEFYFSLLLLLLVLLLLLLVLLIIIIINQLQFPRLRLV